MAVFARFMGWLAVAVGIAAAILPFVVENAFQAADAILIAFVGIFAGVGLVVLAKTLTIAEKIEEHTNWFSGTVRPSASPTSDESSNVQSGSRADRRSEQAAVVAQEELSEPPEPDISEAAVEEVAVAAPPPVPRPSEPRPAADVPLAEPEVYDSARHPAAIEEWAYEDLRAMTLEDGSLAVELDAIWYRFVNVEDMVAYLTPVSGQKGS